MQDIIRGSLNTALNTLQGFMADSANIDAIAKIALQIADCYRKQGKVIIFGNGGSMCDAMHFAEELTGKFRRDRQALPAIAISDPSHITCVGNDYGFDEIFARGVQAYSMPGDIVIGLSTSGNSPNIIKALNSAQSRGCITVALLGNDGGKLAGVCDYEIIVRAETSDRVQEVHTTILHILIETIENELFYPTETQAIYT